MSRPGDGTKRCADADSGGFHRTADGPGGYTPRKPEEPNAAPVSGTGNAGDER